MPRFKPCFLRICQPITTPDRRGWFTSLVIAGYAVGTYTAPTRTCVGNHNLSASSSPRRQWATGSRMTMPDGEAQPIVVVIDDDPDIREALRGFSDRWACAPSCSPRFRNSSIAPTRTCPNAWFSTVRLPGRSGLDFQEELAKANLRLPIIFIRGHADVPMSVRTMKAGAVEFLTKPVRDQDLLDAIQLAIAQDRARRDNERVVAERAHPVRHADAE